MLDTLPPKPQGYVDPNEAPMKKLGSIFGWNKKTAAAAPGKATKATPAKKAGKPVAKKGGKAAAKAAEDKPKKTGWW